MNDGNQKTQHTREKTTRVELPGKSGNWPYEGHTVNMCDVITARGIRHTGHTSYVIYLDVTEYIELHIHRYIIRSTPYKVQVLRIKHPRYSRPMSRDPMYEICERT